jgi:hypothetical protein
MVGRSRLPVRVTWAGLTLLLTVVALAYHAAQPYTRAPREALEGRCGESNAVDEKGSVP